MKKRNEEKEEDGQGNEDREERWRSAVVWFDSMSVCGATGGREDGVRGERNDAH